MAVLEIKWNLSRKELRMFAAVWFPLACLVLGLLIRKWTGSTQIAVILWSIAAVLAVIAFFIPRFASGLYVAWMVAAFPIGWTISHLMMGLIYYGVITPMGLIMRACGRDSMGRNFNPAADSYWVPHVPPKDKKQYFKQY